jgi:alpha-glucosidase
MLVERRATRKYTVFEINTPVSLLGIRPPKSGSDFSKHEAKSFFFDEVEGIEFRSSGTSIVVRKELFGEEHVLGLGEKALRLDRRRVSVKMWNTDAFEYSWDSDPLYASIPFFISLRKGEATGYFIDSTAKIMFDVGIAEYDKIAITVPSKSFSFYVVKGPEIETVLESYATLTGLPAKIPDWALGHQISRYSYFPQKRVLEVVRDYQKHDYPVSCVHLDIDYMEDKKIFTWDTEKFPSPKKMIEELHSMGVKVVAILDPGIKMDQSFQVFREGIGSYCETPNGELSTGKVWPGECVFPDYLNSRGRDFWSSQVAKFVSESGLDGIWLDMNEPAVFNNSRTLDENVVHKMDDGTKLEHSVAHNAYAYFQAKATFEALSKISKEPFILTRAGCAGIQKFAAMWSGDNTSSWENMRLQIPLLLSLSISGVPFVGCDVGGFTGNSSPELLTRFYQMAAFFPIFRNHKSKEGNDQEPYRLPSKYQSEIKRAISLRYSVLSYLSNLALEASKLGHPIIRPLFYNYQDDEETYAINDEYMVGKFLLFAPIVREGENQRDLYLPRGRWVEWGGNDVLKGGGWIRSEAEMPLFVRTDIAVPSELKKFIGGQKG